LGTSYEFLFQNKYQYDYSNNCHILNLLRPFAGGGTTIGLMVGGTEGTNGSCVNPEEPTYIGEK